ncbi:hypothetical protein M2399_003991 [Pseudomonas sp. BIGb0450]|nr:hypothetical protein [Pseudomonas sp. BIGb0558]MCS3438536.1 hypothetical protein [Pseudomonas sp. BIGb0450]
MEALAAQEWDLVTVAEATGGVIDAGKINNVQIDGWPFMQPGQPLWIDLHGTEDLALRNGRTVTAAEFNAKLILEPIPASYLMTLRDTSTLEITAYVSLDGTNNKATAQQFEMATYVIKAGVRPEITRLATVVSSSVPNGGSSYEPRATLTGRAEPLQEVEVFYGATSKGFATANNSGVWTLTVTDLTVGTQSFTAVTVGGGLTSDPWVLTVLAVIAPQITRVGGGYDFGSGTGETIPDGGTWNGRTINVSGTGTPGHILGVTTDTPPVEILYFPTRVAADGTWSTGLYQGYPLNKGFVRVRIADGDANLVSTSSRQLNWKWPA